MAISDERDAAYARLAEILENPNFVGKYMRPNKATMIFVPHGKYVARVTKLVRAMFSFDDVKITVSTVSHDALRGARYTYCLIPPAKALVAREANQIPKIREDWAITNRFFDHFTEY